MQDITPIFEKIKEILIKEGVDYRLFNHPPVFTSEEAATVRQTPIEFGAKAILLYADKKPILIVVPGNRRIDTKLLKKQYDFKDVRIMTKEEIFALTGLEIGAIPPMGNVLGIPTYLDGILAQGKEMVFNVGSHTHSVKMATGDFIKIASPVIADISCQPNV